jgi:DNA-binding transcriptional regulator YiaG
MIPLGQPILVSHHSEKRHRKDLTRIGEHFAKAKEHHDKAEYFRRRAAAAESNVVIFSDDPDATEKLVDKIERLKKRQGVMKRANQLIAWRKINRLSQRKAVAVLAQYYFHATFASLRSWEEGRRSPNSHTAAILEKFLLDHPTVERPKK